MNIVYLLAFTTRIKNREKPYFYIGSKSNCSFDGKYIIDKNGRPYLGSSKWKDYSDICTNEKEIKTFILATAGSFQECLDTEKNFHIKLDVVANTKFFNKSIAAAKSNFTNPDFGTYRHIETNKTVRLPRNHPKVLSGEYVNANFGYKTYNDGEKEKQFLGEPPEGWVLGKLECNILSGEENSFFGKRHTDQTKKQIVETRNDTYKKNPERHAQILKDTAERTRRTMKGVPKTKESNMKRARKGFIVLKNKNTGECVRISKEEKENYDLSLWQNPFRLSEHNGKPNGRRWYTNGEKNVMLGKDEIAPDGFSPGRKYTNWNDNKVKKMKITKITAIGKSPVFDISVDSAEHYILENGVVSHNSGILYASNQAFIISKSQEKEGTDLSGWKFTINVEKSRFVREKSKLPFTVLYDSGIQKWSGLFDLAVDAGFILKPKQGWYQLVDPVTGEISEKNYREKDVMKNDAFFEDLIKNEKFITEVENRFKLIAHLNSTPVPETNDDDQCEEDNGYEQ